MALEIERKYLVDNAKWRKTENPTGHFYRQGYLSTDPARTVRVRATDTTGFITIKGLSLGATRTEYEYEIPLADAKTLIDKFATSELIKTRYKIEVNHKMWDVDEYLGENSGLIVAEIELQSEDESFSLPPWIDHEVTGEQKYYNARLAMNPYHKWS